MAVVEMATKERQVSPSLLPSLGTPRLEGLAHGQKGEEEKEEVPRSWSVTSPPPATTRLCQRAPPPMAATCLCQ
ncbi:Os04g0295300 [Oryza sativa Japonica Group]|uniref:Os04g0295300 protein n=1 Tax=Oryza sativa subsp. japonica TaxID=39947 RepID=A0A0P0W866_ORYSJ|nr:Os04g0295300 [Oryza sativa Japonica Group]